MKIHPVRLKPGGDLKASLDRIVTEQQWAAACIVSAVGSLTDVAVRYAGRDEVELLEGRFEIVSLCGTLSCVGGSHLHIGVSDADGRTIGGHLKNGSLVYTTAEIILGILEDWEFSRLPDKETGFLELEIRCRKKDQM